MSDTVQHVLVGFANPFLVCARCKIRTPYWHNTERCGCDEAYFLSPCKHIEDTISTCATWTQLYGCTCENGCKVPK